MTNTRALAALAAIMVLSATGCSNSDAPVAPVAPVQATGNQAPGAPAASGVIDPRLATMALDQATGRPAASEKDVTFHFDQYCAYLSGPQKERTALVWPADNAWIDKSSPDTIELRESDSGKVTSVTDEKKVSLSGVDVTGITSYVKAPHESCSDDKVMLVLKIG
ncbi:hypothetical protein AB0F81_38525 [Actinoplanes sp. NPDC024001]|uniref:hypothetical protein n=1 Tax=Actinoplanes sp. NPDC024001 TaxID=3154598 RepID=UPI003404F276